MVYAVALQLLMIHLQFLHTVDDTAVSLPKLIYMHSNLAQFELRPFRVVMITVTHITPNVQLVRPFVTLCPPDRDGRTRGRQCNRETDETNGTNIHPFSPLLFLANEHQENFSPRSTSLLSTVSAAHGSPERSVG